MNNNGTYEREDRERLGAQLEAVRLYMLASGDWKTLAEIDLAFAGRYPQASISARLRDLRRKGYEVARRHRRGSGRGTFEYRVAKAVPTQKQGALFA